jgi:hypothetical protein
MDTGAILKQILTFVAAIAVVIPALYGVNSYMDSKIESKINNADFLKKLARNIRPSLVFDDKGSIISDMGAASLVSNISVSQGPKHSLKIIVSSAEFVGVEPVLEALDDRYMIRAERGQRFDWVFHLTGIRTLVMEDSPKVERHRFRLEIIR